MSENVGSIAYDARIDTKNIKSDAKEVDSTVKNLAKDGEKNLDKFEDIGKKAAITLGVAGAGLTLFAKSATDSTVSYVKSAKDLSRQTGASIEDSSRLLNVLNRVGIDADQAALSFNAFSKKIIANDDSFKKLGVSVLDVQGKQRTFNQILLDTADKFKAMPDGVEKTALSLDLFGRSGQEMVKILNLGSGGIADLEKQADKLGLTLNENTIGRVSALIESQKQLRETTEALKITVGETTAPVLTSFNNKIAEIIGSLLAADSPVKGLTANVLAFGGPALTFSGAALGVAANITTIASEASGAKAALVAMQGTAAAGVAIPVTAGLVALGLIIAKAIETKNVLEQVTGNIQKNVNTAKNSLDSLYKSLQGTTAQAERAQNALLKMGVPQSEINKRIMSNNPQFASGTNYAPGGMALVGEKGPEIVNLPRGSQVIPNDKLDGMMGGASIQYNIGTITISTEADGERWIKKLTRNQEIMSKGLTPGMAL